MRQVILAIKEFTASRGRCTIDIEIKTIKTNNQKPSAGGACHEDKSGAGEIRAALSGEGGYICVGTKDEESVL